MCSSVSAGSRTSQRMAFSQNRWNARPSSPSPAARNPQCHTESVSERERAPLAGVARHQDRRRLAVGALERRVGQQRGGVRLGARHPVDPLERRQLRPARLVFVRVEQQRGDRVRLPLGRQARLEEIGGQAGVVLPLERGRHGRQLDGQHVAQRGEAVAAAGERQVAADHGDGAPLLDVVAHVGEKRLDAVGGVVEVLEDHQVERAELLLEDLEGGERDQRQIVVVPGLLVGLGAQDEERHQIDVGIAAQHRAQEALVPRGPAGQVQDADAIPDHLQA